MAISRAAIRLLGWGALAFSILPISAEASTKGDSQGSSGSQFQETISGKILKVGKDRYVVRTSDGDRVSLNVTDDTFMKCSKGSNQSQKSETTNSGSSGSGTSSSSAAASSPANPASSSSDSMAQPKGFRIGDCGFEKGDRIRTKVDDAGDIIYLTGKSKNSRSDMRSSSSSRDFPDHYLVLPASVFGEMEMKDTENQSTLKSKDGEKIGKIIKTLSTEDGDLAYAIVKKESGTMISVPWEAIQSSSGSKTSMLDIPNSQLENLPILEQGETTVKHVRKNWDLFEYDQDENAYRGFERNRNSDQRVSRRSNRDNERDRYSSRNRSSSNRH